MALRPIALDRTPAEVLAALACEPGAFSLAVPDPDAPVPLHGGAPDDGRRVPADAPAPIDDAVTFAYLTAWSRAEVLGLTWREVDRAHGLITLPPARSKHGEPRELPLSPALSALIEKRHGDH